MSDSSHKLILDEIKLEYERVPGDEYITRRVRNWRARLRRRKGRRKKADSVRHGKS